MFTLNKLCTIDMINKNKTKYVAQIYLQFFVLRFFSFVVVVVETK